MDDVRVLAIEQYGAGPWGTMQLADLGAEVIKIEDPTVGGDVSRYVPPYQEGESSLFFETFNRGKRSLSLDLRHPDARVVFEDLVRSADAVFSNLRGDQPDRLGLRFEQLKQVNPLVVCCSLSGFGITGPRLARGRIRLHAPGHGGLAEHHRRARRPPDEERPFTRGLLRRIRRGARDPRRDPHRSTRRGRPGLRRSLGGALSMLSYLATWYLTGDTVPTRRPGPPTPLWSFLATLPRATVGSC